METSATKKLRLEKENSNLSFFVADVSILQEETKETVATGEVTSNEAKEQNREPNRIYTYTKKQRYYIIPQKTLRQVNNFFFREDISTPLPQKRYANKHGPGYVMQVTLFVAFSIFKTEHKECRIGFTKFTTLRPKNVRLLSNRHWNYCVCLVCQNISYKLKALNRCMPGKIADFDQLLNVVLCSKSDAQRFHLPDCIFKKCQKCQNTESKLSARFPTSGSDKNKESDLLVTWNHWEKVVEGGKTRRVLKSKRSSVAAMIKELLSDFVAPVQGTSFAEHLFVGQWQQRQFSELKKNLPPDSVLLVMDFGKNRTVRYQDEPKSVFFAARQITIHPVVVFYHSRDIPHLVVRHSLVFLSDDHTHDHHAVDHFFEKSLEYLKVSGIPFSKLFVFSDGCAGQYKGKGSFADLSLKNIRVERNYFGSDHGKSECDGEVGCINRAVDIAIVGRKAVIANAEDMYSWCSASSLCLDEAGSKRRFFVVKTGEVNRERNFTDVTTLQGCRKLHQFVNTLTPYQLLVRKLSCFCANCMNGFSEECPNRMYTGDYENRILKPTKSIKQPRKTSSAQQSTPESPPTTTSPPHLRKTLLAQQSTPEQPTMTTSTPRPRKTCLAQQSTPESPATTTSIRCPSKRRSAQQSTLESPPTTTSTPRPRKTRSAQRSTATTLEAPKTANSEHRACTPQQSTEPLRAPQPLKTQAGRTLWEKVAPCSTTYEDLQQTVIEMEIPPLPKLPNVTFISHKRTIDESALALLPDNLKHCGLFPSTIYGDGNCLPRCASLLAYGTEDNHLEMRARIICELVRHEEKYLDNKYLTEGADLDVITNVAKLFAMFSEHYNAERLTNLAIQRIFRKEVLSICASGRYMGIWQIAALANILERDVVSVYPLYGGKTVRNDLNRMFMPVQRSEMSGKQIYVMWSNLQGSSIPEKDWRPNHFVPLLKTCTENDVPCVEEDAEVEELSPIMAYGDDDDPQDAFLNSSLVNSIIQGLDNISDETTSSDEEEQDIQMFTEDLITVCDMGAADDQHTVAEHTTHDDQAAADDNTVDETTRDEQEQDIQMFTEDLITVCDMGAADDQHTVAEHTTHDDQAAADDNTVDETTRDEQEQDMQMFTENLIEAAEDLITACDEGAADDQHTVAEQTTQDDQAAVDDNTVDEPCVNQTAIDDQMATDDDDQTVDELVLADTTKYRIGDFIIAKCGKEDFPCLVVQTTPGMQSLPEVGVWVQYLKTVRASLWALQEKAFFLEFTHICRHLEPPSIKVMGERVYYNLQFKSNKN